jgi:hypothetical protein
MAGNAGIKTLRPGDSGLKSDPFTIAIIANPALERPWNSGNFVVDPLMANEPAFDSCAQYIQDVLFGNLPQQRERFLGDPAIEPHVRLVSLFVAGLPPDSTTSLVGEDGVSSLLVARRTAFASLLAGYGLRADVVYAVSSSTTHNRASAWFTSDDDSRAGTPFMLDGLRFYHRHYSAIPGTVALPANSYSLTALHEFGHALSSYSNGSVMDLYVDGEVGLNKKLGLPIPAQFANYNGTQIAADTRRDGMSYPAGWQTYHGELLDQTAPAIMDDYWLAPGGVPEHCLHDRITRQFLTDRLWAKINR